MPPRIYKSTIEPRDVDFTLRATLVALTNHILDVAGYDADAHGFGVRDIMSGDHTTWVLLRVAVEVERIPDQYEELAIETWVNEVGRLMTTRNFRVRDASGSLVASAVTNWATIDLSTRRPASLDALDYAGRIDDIPSPIAAPAKLGAVAGGEVMPHRVAYSDIDFNRHTNSMKYLEWMVDMLPAAYHTEKRLRRLELNFLKETRLGEQLEVGMDGDAAGARFEVRKEDGTPACRASMEWV